MSVNTNRLNRHSILVLIFASLFLAYQLIPEILAYTLTTDGWTINIESEGKEPSSYQVFLMTYLLEGSSPIRSGDELLAVNGVAIEQLISEGMSLNPQAPSNWQIGQAATYTILRDGQQLDLSVPLQRLSAHAFWYQALDRWGNPWLALFMYLIFLPAMVLIGVVVFYHQPRLMAAHALLIISLAFMGQVTYSPNSVVDMFTWYRSVPYYFLLHRWTAIIIPTTLLLALSFPKPKGMLRRHLGLSLALIYLPWWLFTWLILVIKTGDLIGIYQWWIGMSLAQLFLVFLLITALVHSFLTIQDPVERAQLKWFAFGLMGFVMAGGLTWLAGAILNITALNMFINYFGYLFLPFCLAVAILRYRLWDINVIIRRTLLYTTLTGLFGLLYFGSVVVLRQALSFLTGESTLAIVLSTLLVAALFEPVRRHVQGLIDRRFYRQKYDAALALEEFSSAARREVALDRLTSNLVSVVENTIQPEQVSVWLRDRKNQV